MPGEGAVEAGEDRHARALDDLDQFADARGRHVDRLFAEDRLAGFCAGLDQVEMRVRRRADDDGLDRRSAMIASLVMTFAPVLAASASAAAGKASATATARAPSMCYRLAA